MASFKYFYNGTYHNLGKIRIMTENEEQIITQTLGKLSLQENEDGLIYIYYNNQPVGEGIETGPRYGAIITNLESLGILEGETGGFKVKLSRKPTSNQEVNVVSNDLSIATISPSTLIFTPENWNVEQVVTVQTIRDNDDVDASTFVALTTTNDSKTLAINVADVDEFFGQILLGTETLRIDEGASETFTIKLDQKPTNNQTVNISGDSGLSVSPQAITFTPSDWNVEKTITVTAADDEDSGNKNATITATTTNSTKTLGITIVDNDVPTEPEPDQPGVTYGNVLTSHATIAMDEGSDFIFRVKLGAQPVGIDSQLVVVGSSDPDMLSVEPGALYFTPDNWDQIQEVTLHAAHDSDTDNGITHIYVRTNNSSEKTVNVNIRDIDEIEEYPDEPMITIRVYNNRTIDDKWKNIVKEKWKRIPTATRQYIINGGGNILIVDPEQDSTVWVDEAGQDYSFANVAGFTSQYTTYLPTRESSLEASATHEMGHLLLNMLKNKNSSFRTAWNGEFNTIYNAEKANVPFLLDEGSETNFNHHTKNTTEYFPEIFEYIVEKRIPESVWLERAPRSYAFVKKTINLEW